MHTTPQFHSTMSQMMRISWILYLKQHLVHLIQIFQTVKTGIDIFAISHTQTKERNINELICISLGCTVHSMLDMDLVDCYFDNLNVLFILICVYGIVFVL